MNSSGKQASQACDSLIPKRRPIMLYTIAIILLVLWLLGMVTSVAGGLIHILLVAAVVVILVRLFTGRKVL
ncbi:hypothetical protein GCM10027317_21010 [Massilia agri]